MPAPCLTRRDPDTHNPVVVIKKKCEPRFCNIQEKERLVGLPTNYSAYDGVTHRQRADAVGNIIGSDTLWAICRHFKVGTLRIHHSLIASEVECLGPVDQLAAFQDLRDQGRLTEWFDAKAQKLVMPLLNIHDMLNGAQTVPYRTSAPGWTKPGLGPSCDYCIDMCIKAGTHVMVELEADMWVCLCFFSDKGRVVVADFDGESYSKGDELHAMRPLRDYRAVNAAVIKGIPKQWVEHGPTIEVP